MNGGADPRRVCGMMWLVFAAALPLFFLTSTPAQTQETGIERTFVAAFVRDARPQFLTNKKGQPVGFARDVLRDVARLAGVRVKFRVVDTVDEAFRLFREGRIDLIPDFAISPDRSLPGLSTAPVDTVALSVFVRQDASQIQTFGDLRGKHVGLLRSGSDFGPAPKIDGVIPVLRRSARAAVMDLLAGQLDAVIAAGPDMSNTVRALNLGARVRRLGAPLSEVKRGILVSARERWLWLRLDGAVRRYVGTPAYARVYRKWYGSEAEFWTVSRVAWLIGGLALGGLAASFGWRFHSVAKLNQQLTGQTAISRSVLDNVDQGFTLFDADLKLIAFNERFIELLDFPRELTRVGAPFASFIRIAAERGELGTGDVEEIVLTHVEAVKRAEPRNFLRPGKNGRTIDVRGTPTPDGGFVTTFTDVTDQMRVDDALRVSEQQLSEAQRIGGIGHWRFLIDTHRFECSDAFYRIYGWDPATFEATFTAITDAVHPDDRDRVRAVRKQAGDRKEAYRCEF